MIIAVDFDGTVVDHEYLLIGKEVPGALQTLRDLVSAGNRIILFTMRSGFELGEATLWFQKKKFLCGEFNTTQSRLNGHRA